MLMAWHREIGLEFVHIIVKSDNEPALTSLIESCTTLKSGSRRIIENSPVASWKSDGIVERAIQSVQGTITEKTRAIEEPWAVKIEVTYSMWPWIAEQAILLTRFRVGRDGKTTYERLRGKSAKVQGVSFAEVPLGKLTCLLEDKQPREKSSWRTEMAFGSQERSGGRQRRKDGNEATWR